jgi:ParD-like antitoxin of type II bacterial toxin-antitoxin system
MSQPVKLSDSLVLDARLAGELEERSIAGQVEFWAKLGRSVDLLLSGRQVLQLCRNASARPISECLEMVDTPEGRQRFKEYMASKPFPHFEPDPERKRVYVRIDVDGTRTTGRFVDREFRPIRSRTPR